MEGSSSAARIDRKSSIETEPRTLSIDQIQYAREAALYVMSTKSIEEAVNVFMEGLESVEKVNGTWHNNTRMESEEEEEEEEEEEDVQYLERQLQVPAAFRDIASAPF